MLPLVDLVIRIREDFNIGKFRKSDLAKKYGVCKTTIKQIVMYETWKINAIIS